MREQADEIVLVLGAGTIGCLAVNVCKAYKASKIICIDVIDWKLEIAKKMGADVVVNATKFKSFEERMEFMMKETNGSGVGIIIECSGHAGTISNMFKYLRKGGTAVMVGLPKQDLVFTDPMPVNYLFDMYTINQHTNTQKKAILTFFFCHCLVVKLLTHA